MRGRAYARKVYASTHVKITRQWRDVFDVFLLFRAL